MKLTFLAIVMAAAALSTGCATRAMLTPAPYSERANGRDWAAVSTQAGIKVTAQAEAWTGLPSIRQELTPLWVEIVNNSDKPLRVCYGEFALESADGSRYRALPPFELEGTASAPALVGGYSPISPTFVHDGFWIAPWYSPLYPSMRVVGYPFLFDGIYYSTYYPHWARYSIGLPTPRMLAQALPEGVLDAGGKLAGFLYFEKVDPDEKSVTFRTDLVDAREGGQFGEVTIPFRVIEQSAARSSRREGATDV